MEGDELIMHASRDSNSEIWLLAMEMIVSSRKSYIECNSFAQGRKSYMLQVGVQVKK